METTLFTAQLLRILNHSQRQGPLLCTKPQLWLFLLGVFMSGVLQYVILHNMYFSFAFFVILTIVFAVIDRRVNGK